MYTYTFHLWKKAKKSATVRHLVELIKVCSLGDGEAKTWAGLSSHLDLHFPYVGGEPNIEWTRSPGSWVEKLLDREERMQQRDWSGQEGKCALKMNVQTRTPKSIRKSVRKHRAKQNQQWSDEFILDKMKRTQRLEADLKMIVFTLL